MVGMHQHLELEKRAKAMVSCPTLKLVNLYKTQVLPMYLMKNMKYPMLTMERNGYLMIVLLV